MLDKINNNCKYKWGNLILMCNYCNNTKSFEKKNNTCIDKCHIKICKTQINNIKDVKRILFNTYKMFNNKTSIPSLKIINNYYCKSKLTTLCRIYIM